MRNKNLQLIRLTILIISVVNVHKVKAQNDGFYIQQSDKKKAANYYFRIMDSIAVSDKKDTLSGCRNCINFMEKETKTFASGETTYFGRFEFTRTDLLQWHLWFERRYDKKK